MPIESAQLVSIAPVKLQTGLSLIEGGSILGEMIGADHVLASAGDETAACPKTCARANWRHQPVKYTFGKYLNAQPSRCWTTRAETCFHPFECVARASVKCCQHLATIWQTLPAEIDCKLQAIHNGQKTDPQNLGSPFLLVHVWHSVPYRELRVAAGIITTVSSCCNEAAISYQQSATKGWSRLSR